MTSTETQKPVDLEELIDSCIASRETRHEDWDTRASRAAAGGDRFKRAQIRYIGSGATGDHADDSRSLPSEHFTFSNMRLPVGAVGPEHTHHDVEEVFFVLEGELEVAVHDVEDGTKTAVRKLGYRDLIRVPAGVPAQPDERGRHRCPVLRGHRHPEAAAADVPQDLGDVRRHALTPDPDTRSNSWTRTRHAHCASSRRRGRPTASPVSRWSTRRAPSCPPGRLARTRRCGSPTTSSVSTPCARTRRTARSGRSRC
ncbi:cupin domain-containing protein [Nocardioides sp. B-3]|uniref:cupin domain-containing protein n=1 Tax=Nocardioides sp. B-3 TaxID=2895565 RepID=UPI002153248B|nr:cupin domain-containing protein [Nocardioides sp. B-3]UUZ60303.1 cupin domain-containing protein [Nocardioides sp. B-3]